MVTKSTAHANDKDNDSEADEAAEVTGNETDADVAAEVTRNAAKTGAPEDADHAEGAGDARVPVGTGVSPNWAHLIPQDMLPQD
jgi:hypothetical protein